MKAFEKECTKCGMIKPFDKFDRGENRCEDCRRAYHREYGQRPENKERARERAKKPKRVEHKRKYYLNTKKGETT